MKDLSSALENSTKKKTKVKLNEKIDQKSNSTKILAPPNFWLKIRHWLYTISQFKMHMPTNHVMTFQTIH